jgi:DnaK suppressor protein
VRISDTRRRNAELRAMLEERQRQLTADMQAMMLSVRTRSAGDRATADLQDVGAADVQDDLELMLLQMKTETLRKIKAALQRLEDGAYGDCAECGTPIPAARLRALPFALRCTACEGARETRNAARRPASSTGGSYVAHDRLD